jgi:hypothetical protein
MSGCSEATLKAMREKRKKVIKLMKYYENNIYTDPDLLENNKKEEVALKENLKQYEKYKKDIMPIYKEQGFPDYKAKMGELNNSILEIKDRIKGVERRNKLINKLTKSNKKNLTKTETQFNKLDRKIISCKNKKSTRKRCPNGSHKNKKTGKCEKK